MDNENIPRRKVCVAGASGRIGSLLVKKLLERGHVVHATVRSLRDPEKTGLLKSLPGADTRLLLFEANLFEAHQFEQAILGCEFVFLVAFPTRPNPRGSKRNDDSEAMHAALQTILSACERSGTVRRLIYTGSVTAASPLDEDGLCSKDLIDESCWTTPDLPIDYGHEFVKFYVSVKTASERQLLSYGDKEGETSLEVVVLTCGLTGGEALVDNTAGVDAIVSPLSGDARSHGNLTFLQNLLCSLPLVHQDDACEAHLFCMGVPLTCGRRFLCASDYTSIREIIAYYRLKYSDLLVAKESEEPPSRITGGSTRLRDMGFEYKYGMEQILDDSVRFAKKLGILKGA